MIPPTTGDGNEAPFPDESAADSAQQTSGAVARVDWENLPGPVAHRLAELSAAALGTLRHSDIPAQLRPVVRFAAAKRAKLGLVPLVAALRDSAVFRTAVVDWCRTHRPEALDLEHGDPAVVAAAALLQDSAVATHYVELVGYRTERGQLRSERDSALARSDKLAGEVERLRNELAETKLAAERAGDTDDSEADRLRKRLREQGVRLKEARQEAESARADLERVRQESAAAIAETTAQRDREQAKAQEERIRAERAGAEAETARRSAREARQGDEMRLALLLETMEGALGGLRRELGATGRGPKPADAVSGVRADTGTPPHVPDRAALERLLALPAIHLIVDGYNVTKTGYPEIPLADQRDRLAHQLASLAAQTGVEVTLVFDGADVVAVPAAGPRGVRVLFSEPGVQADDVIRGLVEAEPPGRQLIVATSDQEVVTSVRHRGAYAVASSVLLARINRT
ncbi:NYN domain-containing protein [Haloactinomyces albus]|uniref:RNA-binding protein with PIN domain n=1 Tax=Haloactinomyces albus TaxID=1352928 RepID=A0AAE3ZDU4_9ACTN|nr:NYN domain-containing protein [Haloactinomyces albus]MDR7303092.1 putative RNA-binding protein with PIN domain [Haloactinomyces albus]